MSQFEVRVGVHKRGQENDVTEVHYIQLAQFTCRLHARDQTIPSVDRAVFNWRPLPGYDKTGTKRYAF